MCALDHQDDLALIPWHHVEVMFSSGATSKRNTRMAAKHIAEILALPVFWTHSAVGTGTRKDNYICMQSGSKQIGTVLFSAHGRD